MALYRALPIDLYTLEQKAGLPTRMQEAAVRAMMLIKDRTLGSHDHARDRQHQVIRDVILGAGLGGGRVCGGIHCCPGDEWLIHFLPLMASTCHEWLSSEYGQNLERKWRKAIQKEVEEPFLSCQLDCTISMDLLGANYASDASSADEQEEETQPRRPALPAVSTAPQEEEPAATLKQPSTSKLTNGHGPGKQSQLGRVELQPSQDLLRIKVLLPKRPLVGM